MPAKLSEIDRFLKDFGRWFSAPRIDVRAEMRCRLANMLCDAENYGREIGQSMIKRELGHKLTVADRRRLEAFLGSIWDCERCGNQENEYPAGARCKKCGSSVWSRHAHAKADLVVGENPTGRELAAEFIKSLDGIT